MKPADNKPMKSMKCIARLAIFAAVPMASLLAGCAHVGDAGMTMMGSSVGAVAVLQDTLLLGRVTLLTDRTGTVSLAAAAPQVAQLPLTPNVPRLTCTGSLYYTATTTGVINLRCNDGLVQGLAFTALSATRGLAQGSTALGPLSMVFGMAPADAVGYLTPPAGQRLVLNPQGQPQLQPQQPPPQPL